MTTIAWLKGTNPAIAGGLVGLGLLLGGCNSGDGGEAGAAGSDLLLSPAGTSDHLARFLSEGRELAENGAIDSQQTLGTPIRMTTGAEGQPTASPTPDADLSADGNGAMADDGLTNVQVEGVDEPDLVKTDRQYLYVAEQPDAWVYPMPVILVDPDPGSPESLVADLIAPMPPPEQKAPQVARYRLTSGEPVPLTALELAGGTGFVSSVQLLLSGGDNPKLVALGQSDDWNWGRWFAPEAYSVSQETRLWLFDLAEPGGTPVPVQMTLAGQLVESRRIGDTLYLVSRYYPGEKDPVVPAWTVDGETHDLVDPADCLLPPKSDGYPVLTLLVAVNLDNPAASRAACYAGEAYTLYMSRTAAYIATTRSNPAFDWDTGIGAVPDPVSPDEPVKAVSRPATEGVAPVETLVHRFDLEDGAPRYVASGLVPGGFTGWIGTGSQPRWRFHERDGNLYLVTSWWDADWQDADGLRHQLYVLKPDGAGGFSILSTLPNSADADPIGKPGEDIQSMRYVGERAYIVTFLQTDPLYVLDLSDPLAPRVAGELELPGFSAYLHPIGSDWLLGIGRGEAGGVEANLFDVRDPSRPSVQKNLSICSECDAPLMTDYHAIATLAAAGGTTRVALPVQRWDAATETDWRPLEQAVLLEVGSAGTLAEAGRQDANRDYTALGRVLLIGDRVLQPQTGHVTTGSWPTR